MAMIDDFTEVTRFEDWYVDPGVDSTGCLTYRSMSKMADSIKATYRDFKTEQDQRCVGMEDLVKLVDGEVITRQADLPNVSSGDTAGLVRRMARNLVQNVPAVEIISKFDDDSIEGVIVRYLLRAKIIGELQYTNDMQQNLYASVVSAFTLGYDCVVPVLDRTSSGSWYMKYDSIHYRDVFPEPGVRDVRDAQNVFIRRYLTKGDVQELIRNNAPGWDTAALRNLLGQMPLAPQRQTESQNSRDSKYKTVARGYEIITWYSSTGAPFLTFDARGGTLLRIEKNKHPDHEHPVHFLVLERDLQQPLGKSLVELIFGKQEFQDLMLNGAMKLWYRNINPPIIGYGAPNSLPNMSPGKYNPISNPNARIEPFETNTQTLMQYSQIAQGLLGGMVNTTGAADQQMSQTAGGGMSATPQGVEAQREVVATTTSNYQKAIEAFFSHYCSYALTVFIAELRGVEYLEPTADARQALLGAGAKEEWFSKKPGEMGRVNIDFSRLATTYYVRTLPGSLTQLEDDKQLQILQSLLVALSQAMNAMAATENPEVVNSSVATLQYIMGEMIRLSGSNRAADIQKVFRGEPLADMQKTDDGRAELEQRIGGALEASVAATEAVATKQADMDERLSALSDLVAGMLDGVGVPSEPSEAESNSPELVNSTR